MNRLQMQWATGVALVALLGILGGCGVSSSEETIDGFELNVADESGGLFEAGDVSLFLPQDALTEPTQVSILPQAEPFPIAPDPQDPCEYTNDVFPPWCIGPVGHPLAVDSLVQIRFDPALLPPDFDLNNLVLLQWDDSLQALVPNLDAVLNTTEFYFEDAVYRELGHIQVGLRNCPPGGIVFNTMEMPEDEEVDFDEQLAAVIFGDEGLYVMDVDVDTIASIVETESNELPRQFIYTQDEQRIIFDDADLSENPLIKTVLPEPAAVPKTIAGPPLNIELADAFLGGLRLPAGKDVYFRQFVANAQPVSGGGGSTDLLQISRVSSFLDDPVATTYDTPAVDIELIDLRQSSDGQYALVLVNDLAGGGLVQGPGVFLTTGNRIVIVDIPNASIVSDGAIPVGGGLFTPRFTPDLTGVYYLNSTQTEALRRDLDGSNEQVLWSPGYPSTVDIVDFYMLPDSIHFVALITTAGGDAVVLGEMGNPGTTIAQSFQGGPYIYHETILHPLFEEFPILYVDREDEGGREVIPYILDPTNPTASRRLLPRFALRARGLEKIDVNRKDGRLLQVVEEEDVLPPVFPEQVQINSPSPPDPSLQSVLNTALEFDSVSVGSEQTGDSLFEIGPGNSSATILIEASRGASSNELGIYEEGNPDNRVTLFTGSDGASAAVSFDVKLNGDVVLVGPAPTFTETLVGTGFTSQKFGFFLRRNPSGSSRFFYSETVRNAGEVQMVAFRGDGTDNLNLDGNPDFETPFGINDFVIAWEDRPESVADRDYQDMVVVVTNLLPIPPTLLTNIFVTDELGADPIPVPVPEGQLGVFARWRASMRTTPGMFFPPRVR